jgi:hypothetical protein
MFEEEEIVYKLFISHINEYNDEYNLFLEKLSASYDFSWEDYAVKEKSSAEELERQVKPVDVVIILSGLCSKNRDLILRQLDAAQKLNKPVVVIRPYGMENIPSRLEKIASGVVGWNTPCIVDAIRENSPYNDSYEE